MRQHEIDDPTVLEAAIGAEFIGKERRFCF
jgi:hypothetical protein